VHAEMWEHIECRVACDGKVPAGGTTCTGRAGPGSKAGALRAMCRAYPNSSAMRGQAMTTPLIRPCVLSSD
jgi:hypothetical protein